MGLITKEDVQRSVIRLHQSGKKYPMEYEKIRACRTQEEINSAYKSFVLQLTNSIWDYFSIAKITLPSKESWDKATYIAMANKGDISAQLMLDALKECRQEAVAEVSKEEREDTPFHRMSTEEKLCSEMLGHFTRLWWLTYNQTFYESYPVSNDEIECEMDRLGLPISKAGIKRDVVWAGLKLRKYYEDKNINELYKDSNGNLVSIPKRTLTSLKDMPVLWECMPNKLKDSIDSRTLRDMHSRLA